MDKTLTLALGGLLAGCQNYRLVLNQKVAA